MFKHHLMSVSLLAASLTLVSIATPTVGQAPKSVVVATVIEDEVRSGQRVVGTVSPLRTSTIGSAVEGRVREFLVDAGNAVEKGQTLAQLRTETLQIERAAAEAELELALSRLAELENGSLPEEIAEADANMRSAQAASRNADRNLRRMESLAQRSAASDLELDDARQQANAAKFALKATEALLQRIKDGPRRELIAQAKAQVELQRQQLNLISDRIEKSTIRAPFSGFVSAEFTEVGAWITRGDPIAEVIQMDEIEVLAPVTADAVVGLRIGDEIRVEFPELPNELLTGKIDRIVPVATSRARTFPVFIRLGNRMDSGTPIIKAGMLARVQVPVGQRQLSYLVPKDALVLNGNDRAVFVIRQPVGGQSSNDARTGTVEKVDVELGVAVGNRIQVTGNLKAGDQVVIRGNERLIPNSQVRIVPELDLSAQ
jgi:HlyD family secretion protein